MVVFEGDSDAVERSTLNNLALSLYLDVLKIPETRLSPNQLMLLRNQV